MRMKKLIILGNTRSNHFLNIINIILFFYNYMFLFVTPKLKIIQILSNTRKYIKTKQKLKVITPKYSIDCRLKCCRQILINSDALCCVI